MHHAIEEQNIFPILAQKMTVFHHNAAHLDEHAAIHAGSFLALISYFHAVALAN
jgi:hypothetical protein